MAINLKIGLTLNKLPYMEISNTRQDVKGGGGGRDRQTDRQTDRQRQTETDRQKRSQADRWSERQTETARGRQGKKKLEKNKINFTFNVIILL